MTRIISINKEGKTRRLVLNESFILPDSGNQIRLEITGEIQTIFVFHFSDEGKEFSQEISLNDSDKSIHIRLHQWNGSLGVFTTQPIALTYTLKNKVIPMYLAYRTESKETYRRFEVSLWVEEVKL